MQSWLVSLYMDCPPNLGITCPSDKDKEVRACSHLLHMPFHAFNSCLSADTIADPPKPANSAS